MPAEALRALLLVEVAVSWDDRTRNRTFLTWAYMQSTVGRQSETQVTIQPSESE